MARRPRHESRDRHRERRRDVRRKIWEDFKKEFTKRLRKRFRSSITEFRESYEAWKERIEFLRDVIDKRTLPVFKVTTYKVFTKKIREYQFDKFIMDLPEDLRNEVINALLQISRAQGIDPRVLEKYPWIIAFLREYIAYYKKYPCKHNINGIKVTPVIIRYIRGVYTVYYVLRWSYAKNIKSDPFLGRSRPVSFYFTFLRYKFDDDIVNSLLQSGEGKGDWEDPVSVGRDEKGDPLITIPLRRAVFQSHWVKYYFAKSMGKPEMYYDVDHCSVYAVIERPTKRLREYKSGRKYLVGMRPRHRIKEMLYQMGLRI